VRCDYPVQVGPLDWETRSSGGSDDVVVERVVEFLSNVGMAVKILKEALDI
jgi:hypothetical protein